MAKRLRQRRGSHLIARVHELTMADRYGDLLVSHDTATNTEFVATKPRFASVLQSFRAALFCSNPSLLRYLFTHYPFGLNLKHVRLIRENRTRYKPRVGCQNPLDMSKLWAGQDHTYVIQEQKISSEV